MFIVFWEHRLKPEPRIVCSAGTELDAQKEFKKLLGRAPGVCGIRAEMLKAGGFVVILWLRTLFCSIWSTGVIPTDWKRGLIVPIWKGKECNNYRGVTLLSVPGKVSTRVLLNRIRQLLLDHQRPEQSGFTPKHSTVDRILELRLLTERRREYQAPLLAAYIDFCKAFDSICRDALWRILELRGIPLALVRLMASLYSGAESAVRLGLHL